MEKSFKKRQVKSCQVNMTRLFNRVVFKLQVSTRLIIVSV